MNSDNTGTTTIILLGHLSVVRSSMLLVPSFHLASLSQSQFHEQLCTARMIPEDGLMYR